MPEEKLKTRSSRYKEEIEVEEVEDTNTKTIKIPKKELEKEIKKEKQEETKEEEQKNHPLLNKILLNFIILILLIAAYSTLIEPQFINIKEYKVESKLIPESFHGTKIVQLSDIHYGTTINKHQLKKIVEKINNLKPDIVVFTGDLLDKNIELTETSKEELILYLSSINCTLYKYAIYGDEDLDNKDYKEIITTANFTLLDNKSIPLYYKDKTPIIITGFNPMISNPTYEILNHKIDDEEITNNFKIVLTHEPDSITNFISYQPNLVLSGHSLGGIIDLKFTKPLLLPENSTKYYEDYQKIESTDLYVSNGLGTNSLNMRILNPPSISLYRLYKTK